MNHLSFNRRLLVSIIVLVQLVFVLVFAYGATLITTHDFRVFTYLPSVESMYYLLDVSWIGYVRETSHILAGLTNLTMGIATLIFSFHRKTEIIKFLAMTFGIQLVLSSIMNFLMAGIIDFGGWWHVLSAGFVSLLAASSFVSLIILFVYRHHIRALGAWQDDIASDEDEVLIKNMLEYETENNAKVFK